MAINGLGTNRMPDTHRWHHRKTPHGGSLLTDRKLLDRNLGMGKKAERKRPSSRQPRHYLSGSIMME
jgi:hypothetical protein